MIEPGELGEMQMFMSGPDPCVAEGEQQLLVKDVYSNIWMTDMIIEWNDDQL